MYWSVVWISRYLLQLWLWIGAVLLIFTYFSAPWHPKDQKTDTSVSGYAKSWTFEVCSVRQCYEKAQFHSVTLCLRWGQDLFLLDIQVPLKSSLKSVWTCQFTIKFLMNRNMGLTCLHNLELLIFCPLIWSLFLISVKILSWLFLELREVLVGWASAICSPVNGNPVLVCDSRDWIFPHN